MADSIYDQVLDIAAPQIKTLADAIEFYLIQEPDLTPRKFDWKDINSHTPGLSLRYSLNGAVQASVMAATNTHNPVGFPLYVVMLSPPGSIRDDETKAFELLKQSLRQYYHHRRRMEDVSSEGVLTSVSTVSDGGPQPPADMVSKYDIQIMTIMFWFEEPQTA